VSEKRVGLTRLHLSRGHLRVMRVETCRGADGGWCGCQRRLALHALESNLGVKSQSLLKIVKKSLAHRHAKRGSTATCPSPCPAPLPSSTALDLVHGIRGVQARRGKGRGEPHDRLAGRPRGNAAAGLDGPQASSKGLRHGFGVAAVSATIPLNLVQKWLGHAQLATTAIYASHG
jgi:integrase